MTSLLTSTFEDLMSMFLKFFEKKLKNRKYFQALFMSINLMPKSNKNLTRKAIYGPISLMNIGDPPKKY